MAAAYDSTNVKNVLDFQMSLRPSGAFPLDFRTMFGSYEAARAAAETAKEAGSVDSLYYFGQTLTVFDGKEAHQYLIQGDCSLVETGSAVAADDQSITFDQGVVKLFGFGKEYYAFHEKDSILPSEGHQFPDSMPEGAKEGDYIKLADVWYKYTGTEWTPYPEIQEPHETDWYEKITGWKAGLQPKVVSATGDTYELAWFEPSATTVEGISSIVSGIQGEIAGFNSRLGELENKFEELTLPVATLTDKGISRPDGESITINDGVLSVQAVPMGKVTGLEEKLAELEQNIKDGEAENLKGTFVEVDNVITGAVNAEEPSDHPVSEKTLVGAMEWKTEM